MSTTSFLCLTLLAGCVSYVGCSERDDVARNLTHPSDAGAGVGNETPLGGSSGSGGGGAAAGGTATEGGNAGTNVSGANVTEAGATAASDAGENAGGTGNPDVVTGPCKALSFAEAVPYNVQAGTTNSRGLATGDLNGDKKPDLVVTNVDGSASVLLNNGDGSFAAAFSIPTRSSGVGDTVDVIMFDANGDQKLDLAFANYPSGVAVSLNKGKAMFEAPVDYVGADTITSVAAGDLTGDGKADLAVSYQPGGVGVLVNKGNGSFIEAVKYPANGLSWSVAIADFDGMSGNDVVATTANGPQFGPLSLFLNKGGGMLGAEKPYLAPSGEYCYLTTADLGGDAKPDIVLSCGEIVVLINTDPGVFTRVQLGVANPGGRLVTADLLGHGHRDVVVPGTSLWIYPNHGDGSFGTEQRYEYPNTKIGGGAVVSDDFNGDGRPDLAVVTNAKDSLAVLLNTCTP